MGVDIGGVLTRAFINIFLLVHPKDRSAPNLVELFLTPTIYVLLPQMARYMRLQEEGRAIRRIRRLIGVLQRRRARQREFVLILLMGPIHHLYISHFSVPCGPNYNYVHVI